MQEEKTSLKERIAHAAEQVIEPLLHGFDYAVDEIELWVARLAQRMPREMFGHSFDALDSKNMLRTTSFYILAAPGFRIATMALTIAWSVMIPYQTQSREQEIRCLPKPCRCAPPSLMCPTMLTSPPPRTSFLLSLRPAASTS